MTRVRGKSCYQCSLKIDRYDDPIDCKVCSESFHIKCVNISIENFNKMRENGLTINWICDRCEISTETVP